MRQYAGILLVLLLVVATGSGCWDRKELNTLGIVAGIGVDIDEQDSEKVQITAQLINPRAISPALSGGGGGSQAQPVLNRQISGSTIFDAIRTATKHSSRRLYFPHNQVLIVSEELARAKGTGCFLDFFLRDPEPRRSTWVLVAKGRASDVLDFKAVLDQVPARAISEAVQSWTATSQVHAVNVHHFTQDLMSKSSAPIAPYIEKIDDDIVLLGMAVFKNTRMVDVLGPAETRGMLWIRDQVESGIIVVKCNKDDQKVSLEIMNSKTKVTPELRNGEIYMKIDVKVISNLGSQECLHNLTRKDELESLAKQQTTVIENEIKAAIAKAHEYRTDFLLFADAIYRKYPKKWKELEPNWEDIFPTIKVEINVKSSIKDVGMILEPARPDTF